MKNDWEYSELIRLVVYTIVLAIVTTPYSQLNISLGYEGLPVVNSIEGIEYGEVAGISMYPVINNGDYIICDNQSFGTLGKGDIVKYQSDDMKILHRVFARTDNYVITKGDNNVLPDLRLISKDDYICKATMIWRNK